MSGKAVREVLGFLGVIASMVFIGSEIRQNTIVASGEARQTFAMLQHEWFLTLAQDEPLLEAWNDWISAEVVEMTDLAARRASYAGIAWLRHLELVYIQADIGLADQVALDGYGMSHPALQNPRLRAMWPGMRSSFDPGFAAFLDDRIGLSGP